eukprot:g48944.t1
MPDVMYTAELPIRHIFVPLVQIFMSRKREQCNKINQVRCSNEERSALPVAPKISIGRPFALSPAFALSSSFLLGLAIISQRSGAAETEGGSGKMKHNNVLPNGHFKKGWEKNVVTWFNQPAKKVARRMARKAKAQKLAPRPINKLRPVVHCRTVKYNMRVKAGRGFTKDEILAAGFKAKEAQGLGIAVDHRRSNKSEETFQANVARLKTYKSKLVVFPRKGKKVKSGDSDPALQKQVQQVLSKSVLAVTQPARTVEAVELTDAMKSFNAQATVRKARTDKKLAGDRVRRQKKKEAEAALAKKKASKEE